MPNTMDKKRSLLVIAVSLYFGNPLTYPTISLAMDSTVEAKESENPFIHEKQSPKSLTSKQRESLKGKVPPIKSRPAIDPLCEKIRQQQEDDEKNGIVQEREDPFSPEWEAAFDELDEKKELSSKSIPFGSIFEVGAAECVGNPSTKRYTVLEDSLSAKWFSKKDSGIDGGLGVVILVDGHGNNASCEERANGSIPLDRHLSKVVSDIFPKMITKRFKEMTPEERDSSEKTSDAIAKLFVTEEDANRPDQQPSDSLLETPTTLHGTLYRMTMNNPDYAPTSGAVLAGFSMRYALIPSLRSPTRKVRRLVLDIFNIGDVRLLLITGNDNKALVTRLTLDHRLTDQDERNIVERNLGGEIFYLRVSETTGELVSDKIGPGVPRLANSKSTGLAVPRAVGDWSWRVNRKADVSQFVLPPNWVALVLVDDGIYEGMTKDSIIGQLVYDSLMSGEDAQTAAKELVDEGLLRKSTDNLSAIVVSRKRDE